MKSDNTAKRILDALLATVELALFGAALFLSVPQWISDISQRPYTMTQAATAIAVFLASRAMAAARNKRSYGYLVAEVLLFCVFSWALVLRFQSS